MDNPDQHEPTDTPDGAQELHDDWALRLGQKQVLKLTEELARDWAAKQETPTNG